MARQRCGPAAGRSIAAGGSGRVWVCSLAAPRWGDSQHHASTTARHAAARAMFMENRRCNCTSSLRRSILIFTTRACGADWRQALAGSTLRSSAWGRRGPVRSRGTVAEVCPRSGSIRSRSSTRCSSGVARLHARLRIRASSCLPTGRSRTRTTRRGLIRKDPDNVTPGRGPPGTRPGATTQC